MSKHTRTVAAFQRRQQRRYARSLVINYSYQDPILAETVNLLSKESIADRLRARFNYVEMAAVKFELGEVIMDSKGKGSFQQDMPKFH
jgi:hypothetical protein